ncbi:alpha/beta hydrolase [Paenarthrobacter sp. NPDC018779]|uniref:alpha/beta hydrolase n=1 Tax=Paenarthrobacter sp. NPDC018779 TaxID=3364375 RepID=UPI0037C649EA
MPSQARVPVPTLVWAHGGGFFAGGIDQPEAHDVARALSDRGVTVVTVDYRLAPPPGLNWAFKGRTRSRARFPLPMEDLLTALQHVGSQTEGGLILGGASAGACLAASTAFRAVEMDLDLRGAIFAYGFFHAVHPRAPEIQRRVRGHRRLTHSRWFLNALNRNYAGSEPALRDRLAFPGGHDLSGLPSALMINADNDVIRASGDQFAAELRDARVDVKHHILPGSRHAFLNHPRRNDFAKAIDLMASWSLTRCAPHSASG